MAFSKSTFIALFLVFAMFSCETDDASTDDNNGNQQLESSLEYNLADISYGESSQQVFDLFLPANRTSSTKTIILIHGGGWTSGDKNDMNGIRDLIKEDLPNLAIVNINYRLADQNNRPYPMQTNDISLVIEMLKRNRGNYVISDEFGIIGVSAGAHLGLLWSYAFDDEANINMVCSLVGPTNLTDPNYTETEDPILSNVLNIFGENATTEYLEECSPLHQLTASAPPSILFYGGQDPLIPTSQGLALKEKLDALNINNEFTLYPDEGHLWVGLELLDTTVKLKAFIETHL